MVEKKQNPRSRTSRDISEKEKTLEKKEKEIENRIEAEKILLEKVKETEVEEKNEAISVSDIKNESKVLRNLLLVLGLIAVVIAFVLILNNSSKQFTLNGVKYSIVQQGQLIFYNAQIPVVNNNAIRPYNFYLYNDPRVIEREIPFNGSLSIAPGMITVLNITNDLGCNGDGIIGAVNLANLYNLIGKVTNDTNAKCDPEGRFLLIDVREANETSIQQIAPTCYEVNVNNCQVLAATERFMTETFSVIHNLSQSK